MRSKRLSLKEIAREVLAEPYVPGQSKRKGYLDDWFDPKRRGGMLREMSESWFIGSIRGHAIEDLENYLCQFIADAREMDRDKAAERLYLRLMPPTLSNGGPPLED